MLDAARATEALQLLQDNLASEDAELHAHAMRQLCVVADALGPERARKELVPFLGGERPRAPASRARLGAPTRNDRSLAPSPFLTRLPAATPLPLLPARTRRGQR